MFLRIYIYIVIFENNVFKLNATCMFIKGMASESVTKTFGEYMHEYMLSIDNTFILFKINKCCQYSQLLPVYRRGTLADLHESVHQHFGFFVSDIYVLKEENEKIAIPNDQTILVRDFIKDHLSSFKPVFPVPDKVVYNIYFGFGDGSRTACSCID